MMTQDHGRESSLSISFLASSNDVTTNRGIFSFFSETLRRMAKMNLHTDIKSSQLEFLQNFLALITCRIRTNFKICPLNHKRHIKVSLPPAAKQRRHDSSSTHRLKLPLPIGHHTTRCDDQTRRPGRVRGRNDPMLLPIFAIL